MSFLFYTRRKMGEMFVFGKVEMELCSVGSVCVHCPLLSVCRPLASVGGTATFTARDAAEQTSCVFNKNS